MRSRGRAWLAIAAAGLTLAVGNTTATGKAAAPPCSYPSTRPLWIDYADAVSTDVRDVFAKPGVIVSSAGTAGPAYFRAHGAATTYFELNLPNLVGQPATPADPATISAAAAKLLAQASTSTGCSTPWIALNELFGSNLAAPWSATNTVYRANVLSLMQQLAAGGAHPVLLVHGSYTVAGATADWWRQAAQSGDIVYEAYYDATHINALGPLMGNRRMRLGIREFVSDFGAIGINPSQLGVMLGFHTAVVPGIGGREGLEPAQAWFRVVKWEALAARQVAGETGIGSIWSWGWANFSGADPDKATAACVYLWARDQSLCDGPTAAGTGFNASLVEGQIALRTGTRCSLADNAITEKSVNELSAFTHDPQEALTALFARDALAPKVGVPDPEVLAVEKRAITRAFRGDRTLYLGALRRRHATVSIARDIIRDQLRRSAIARRLKGTAETVLEWTDDRESALANSLICVHDLLPGTGNFPASDGREIGVVPLPALLKFLFADVKPPARPSRPAATTSSGRISLAWTYGGERDLAGYEVFRSSSATASYQKISGATLVARPAFVDVAPPAGTTVYYEVRAVDTSGNVSAPSKPRAGQG